MTSYGSHEKHEELKKELINDPSVLGLEDIVSYKEEVPYTKGSKLVGQVDLIFWDKYGTPYLVELTTSQTERARKRVRRQAKRAKSFFNARSLSVIQRDNHLLLEWI